MSAGREQKASEYVWRVTALAQAAKRVERVWNELDTDLSAAADADYPEELPPFPELLESLEGWARTFVEANR